MEELNFSLNGKIWLEISGEKVLGPGRVELLERIQASGSIRQAALQMKMSYNQAWKIVQHFNNRFSSPIVFSVRGGKSGGNARVTDTGIKLIERYRMLQCEFNKFLLANKKYFNMQDT